MWEGDGGAGPVSGIAEGPAEVRCACCHFLFGQWVADPRPSRWHDEVGTCLRHFIRGYYDVRCHGCHISPICLSCQHTSHTGAPPKGRRTLQPLCCWCFRRWFSERIAGSMADWHVGRPATFGALTPVVPVEDLWGSVGAA